jgi:hypothetical protein
MATLAKIGRKPWQMSKADSMPPDHVIVTHLWDSEMPKIRELAQRMPLATTQRDEDEIRQSWIKRGKDLVELDKQFNNFHILLSLNPIIYMVHR